MRKLFFFVAVIITPLWVAGQQVIELDENDVDVQLVTWHYLRYEKSKDAEWRLFTKDGEGIYQVEFVYKGDRYEVAYTTKGAVLWEKIFLTENHIPQKITDLLNYQLAKYRIEYFTKYVEFDKEKKPVLTKYNVRARTKTGGTVEYWFDESFKLIPGQ